MAFVIREGDCYSVVLHGSALGLFKHLLDAHCFAMQLMERGMADSVRLYSGVTVT
jgi:hypothetical protein